MNEWLASVSLADGLLPAMVDVIAGSLLLVAVASGIVVGRRRARRVLLVLAVTGSGALFGLALCWLLSDQLDLFDVTLTPTSRAWVAATFAAVAAGVLVLVAGRWWRRVVGAATVVLALLAGAIGVNADFGQYTTVGSLADTPIASQLPASIVAAQRAGAPGTHMTNAAATMLWRSADVPGLPRHGIVGRVRIPATVSHFPARAAYVYLPPAALAEHPVALPVLIMLSGQPGSPGNFIVSGRLPQIMDALAHRNHGLAPIVVVPDQLGAPERNPMCVDGALGASATYLTVDVPHWIRTHLTVQAGRASWGIGGFSQGGTCSIQLGAGYPGLFSAIVDVSGQAAPKNGGLAHTIAVGFQGDDAAYRAALPVALLADHAPYRSTAVFGVGQLDAKYSPRERLVSLAARAAGMSVSEVVAPGTGHDWHTVQYVLTHGLSPVLQHFGLERPK